MSVHLEASAARVALSRWQRRAVYGAVAALTFTGVAWLIAAGPFANVDAEAASGFARAVAAWSLRLHGIAAYGALVVVGGVLPVHVRMAWARRRNRASGGWLVALLSALACTGLWLYYGGEAGHAAVSLLHWGIGLVLPVWLLVHRRFGLAARNAR